MFFQNGPTCGTSPTVTFIYFKFTFNKLNIEFATFVTFKLGLDLNIKV